MPKWETKQSAKSNRKDKKYTKYSHVLCISLKATPQPSIQSDPIPSEVSGSTDSTLERVPAIVEKVTELAEWSCCKVRETIKQKHTLKYLRNVLYTPLK